MKKLLLLALMAALALALAAPAALADYTDVDYDDDGAAVVQYQYDDSAELPDTAGGVVDDGIDDDDNGEVAMPSTGGPALLPIAGLMLLFGAVSVGVGALRKRRE